MFVTSEYSTLRARTVVVSVELSAFKTTVPFSLITDKLPVLACESSFVLPKEVDPVESISATFSI